MVPLSELLPWRGALYISCRTSMSIMAYEIDMYIMSHLTPTMSLPTHNTVYRYLYNVPSLCVLLFIPMYIMLHLYVYHYKSFCMSCQIRSLSRLFLFPMKVVTYPFLFHAHRSSLSLSCQIVLYNTSHLISLTSLLNQLRGVSLSISRLITMHTLFVNPINSISRV